MSCGRVLLETTWYSNSRRCRPRRPDLSGSRHWKLQRQGRSEPAPCRHQIRFSVPALCAQLCAQHCAPHCAPAARRRSPNRQRTVSRADAAKVHLLGQSALLGNRDRCDAAKSKKQRQARQARHLQSPRQLAAANPGRRWCPPAAKPLEIFAKQAPSACQSPTSPPSPPSPPSSPRSLLVIGYQLRAGTASTRCLTHAGPTRPARLTLVSAAGSLTDPLRPAPCSTRHQRRRWANAVGTVVVSSAVLQLVRHTIGWDLFLFGFGTHAPALL